MSLGTVLVGLFASGGILLILSSLMQKKVSLEVAIAPYLGLPSKVQMRSESLLEILKKRLTVGDSAPWASDNRVVAELRKCASDQSLPSFRFEQLIFAGLGSLLVSAWIVLRTLTGEIVNPLFALILLPISFVGGGGFRGWLLKEASRKRIKEIEAQLPAVLDLLAFAVSAGEPVITAMQRVANNCVGEFSLEIRRMTTGLKVGDNFLVSLDRIQRELASQAVTRAFKALTMAIERGTPIADVLRAQAMDSRNFESRKLMTLAGKKETLMMIPVVFLILPMIVIVALYPGLIALKTF